MENLDVNDFFPKVQIDEYNAMLEEMSPILEEAIRERVRAIEKLTAPYAVLGEFVLSTGLEDNYTTAAWNNLYEVIKSEWQGPVVRSRVSNKWMRKQEWERPSEVYLELHGYRGSVAQGIPCIVNGDGQDVSFLKGSGTSFRNSKPADYAAVTRWIDRSVDKNCVVLLWAGKWQGFFGPNNPPKPLKRRFKFDKSDIGSVQDLLARPSAEQSS